MTSYDTAVMRSPSSLSSSKPLAWLSLLTVWILWGSTYLGIRVGVQSIPPFLMAGTRYVIAGVLLYAILLLTNRRDHRAPTRSEWIALSIKACALLVVGNGLVCLEEQHIASSIAALIIATVPMFMIVLEAAVEKKPVAGWSVAGLAGGMAGVIALVGLPGSSVALGPTLLLVLAALSWAAGSVYARRYAGRSNVFHPALEMIVGGIVLLLVAAGSGEIRSFNVTEVTRPSLLGLLWLIGPGAMLGYSAYMYAVRNLPSGIVSTYAYVNPVVAVILGALVAGEAVTRNVVVGGLLIVLSVVAIIAGGQQRAKEPLRAPSQVSKAS